MNFGKLAIASLVSLFIASPALAEGMMTLPQEDVQTCFQAGEIFKQITVVRDSGLTFEAGLEKLKKDLPNQPPQTLATALQSVGILKSFNPDMIFGFAVGECITRMLPPTKPNVAPSVPNHPEIPVKPKHSGKISIT